MGFIRHVPAYKRQHYLPAAYLKYFSIDQNAPTRDSLVWRFDGKSHHRVPVASQCSADYFYSKEKATETERMFQINEKAYCDCVDRIRIGKDLEGRNRGDLLLCMFDFHLRNAVHKNRTGKEGIEAYGRRATIFIGQILLDKAEEEIAKSEIIEHLEKHWRIEIIAATDPLQFLTCDHPSVWGTLRPAINGVKTELHFVALPITPRHTAIGFDQRVLRILNQPLTAKDLGGLNTGQMQNAEQSVYMSKLLPADQIAMVQKHLLLKTGSQCEINDNSWNLYSNTCLRNAVSLLCN